MLQKPKECKGCVLEDYKGGFSQPEGSGRNGVLIIAEALGENEKNEGLPLRPYAESGSALQTAINNLKKYGVNQTREDFAMWNLVACQPPFNKLEGAKYEESAILHCRQAYFNQVISYYKPKVIFALGNLPLKYLVPEIEAYRKAFRDRLQDAKAAKDKELEARIKAQLSKLKIGALRGYKFNSSYGIPLIPSFHPSFIARGNRVLLGVILRDLMFALEVAQGQWTDYKFENYIDTPSLADINKFAQYCINHPKLPISYDIETPYTTMEVDESEIEFGQKVRDIESIQFSIPVANALDNGEYKTRSIFLDWNEENLPYIRTILGTKNSKIGWNNWAFDESNLKYHLGEEALRGTRYDAMWMFKHLNADFRTIGRGLQFAANFYIPNFPAWKHLSEEEPRQYGLRDVDATLKIHLGLSSHLKFAKNPAPNSKTLWQGYEDDIVGLFPVLQAMSKRGFPVNIEDREIFRKELVKKRKVVLEELQDVYPTELRRPDPQLGYKQVPKEVGELADLFEERFCTLDSPEYTVFLSEAAKGLVFARFLEQNTRRNDDEIKKDVVGQTGLVVREFVVEGNKVKRYCRLDRFKPNSPKQVANYIKFKGYKIKKKKKGKEEVESVDNNAMYDLYEETKDSFFLQVGFFKELRGIDSKYIKGWKLDNEGRVHSTFLPIPATGQFSSVNPNIQNIMSHGTRYNSKEYVELAKRFRNCIQSKEGHTLVGLDYTGFHAIMLGVEADDYASSRVDGGDSAANYIRLAKLGIHDFLTAHMVRNEYSSKKRMVDLKSLGKGGPKSEADALREETLDWTKDLDKWLDYDDNLLSKKLAWIKKNHKLVRDAQAKPAVHGVGFGMGVRKFFTLNKHAFSSLDEPKRILALLRKLFPDVFIWQDYIKELADNQTYLISRYGYIRYFWDVYDWRLLPAYRLPKSEYEKILVDKKNGKVWSRTDGQQVKEAIAFFPANDAFAKKKEAMREMEGFGLLEKYRLILDNHDELLFECPDEFVDECIVEGSRIMSSPAKHIITKRFPQGISCAVSSKIGKKWGEMREYKV